MKTQQTLTTPQKTNKALGMYTIFMVSVSVTYTLSTLLHYLG